MNADGVSRRAALVAYLPHTDSLFGLRFAFAITIAPYPTHAPPKDRKIAMGIRKLTLGVACVMSKEQCKPPFKRQFRDKEPVAVPNRRVSIPQG